MSIYLLSYFIGLTCWYVLYRLVDISPYLSVTPTVSLYGFTIAPLSSLTLIASFLYLGFRLNRVRFKDLLLFSVILSLSLPLVDYIIFGPMTYTTWAGAGEVFDAAQYLKLYNPLLSIPLGLIIFYLIRRFRSLKEGNSA